MSSVFSLKIANMCQKMGGKRERFPFLKVYFIDYDITVVSTFFSPLYLSVRIPHLPAFPNPLGSCPQVIHISSLASPFPMLFLTSPCLFYTFILTNCASYSLYLSLPFSTSHIPLITLWMISISVILFLF